MKFNILNVICLLLFGSFGASGQSLTLNVPQLVEASNTPASGNKITYDVSDLLSDCIDIYGTTPGVISIAISPGVVP